MSEQRWISFKRGSDSGKIWVRADSVVAVSEMKNGTCLSFGDGLEIVVQGELDLVQKVVEHGKKNQEDVE